MRITKNCMRKIGLSALMAALTINLPGCDTISSLTRKGSPKNPSTQENVNVTDKVAAIRQRDEDIAKLQKSADDALSRDDLESAEQYFQELKTLDSNNLRAAEGLNDIAVRRQHAILIEEVKNLLGKSEDDDKLAAVKLRNILVENPNNTEASALYKSLITKQDAKRAEMMRKRLAYKNPVSFQFRDVGLKVIIESIARGTGVNFSLDQEVKSDQKATLFVNNTSLEDAIDMLAQSNQLRKKILNENSVILYPNNTQKLREYQDLTLRSFFLEYADPKLVGNLLTTMLGIKQVQTDDRLPMVMIKDTEEVMDLAEKLIASQDIPDPEVMLELEVLEVRRTRNLDIGVTWPTQLTVIGQGANGSLTLQDLKSINSSEIGVSPNPSIVFKGKDSDVNLLANPRIRVKNKDKARIHIGDRVPIITSNVSSNGVISENVQYIDAGLKLEVEPNISLGGDVSIKVNLDVSSIGEPTRTNSGSVVYQIGTRSTATQLRLKDGETQVLAGLISDEDRKNVDKLPGLGDLPLLGRLFSNHGDENTKTEIVLSITPHIIRERSSPSASLAEYWVGSEAQAGRKFTAPRTQEGISKLFLPGRTPAPSGQYAPQGAPAQTESKPQGLNVPLPPGMSSAIESIRNSVR